MKATTATRPATHRQTAVASSTFWLLAGLLTSLLAFLPSLAGF